ncbi:MAG: MBL fold metallo-hydrolase [Actinomycetota bacterium]
MKVIVVGCSGSVPGPESPGSCYLVTAHHEGREWRVLLDLGSGALGPLQRYVDPRQLDAVLLSHLHPDHYLDLCGLYVMRRYAPQGWGESAPIRRLPVWGPSGTAVRLARAYDLPDDTGMSQEFDVHTWRDGIATRIGPFDITPYRVAHPGDSYGLRVEVRGADGATHALAYTGDTDTCAELIPLCHSASLVLADAAFVDGRDYATGMHLSASRAAQAVVDAGGVRRLVLTHLPPWNNPEAALAQARSVWAGALDVARPGAVFQIDNCS